MGGYTNPYISWNTPDSINNGLYYNQVTPNGFSNLYGLLGQNQTYGLTNNSSFYQDLTSKYGWTPEQVNYLKNNPALQNELFQKGYLYGNQGNLAKPVDANIQDIVANRMANPNYQFNNYAGKGNNFGFNNDKDLFSKGMNSEGQTTWGGATGFQWAGAGIQTAFGLFNAYQAYQANKLAKAQFEDQKRLNHANYQMQAKAYNNNLRNQQSGRGYIGMSGSAKRALGAEYKTRAAAEDY